MMLFDLHAMIYFFYIIHRIVLIASPLHVRGHTHCIPLPPIYHIGLSTSNT